MACGIFPDQGSNPCPLHWKHGVLTTGPPGKSHTLLSYVNESKYYFTHSNIEYQPSGLVLKKKKSACNAGETLGQEDPLEKGMATHSSIFAWRIPWTEEPGRLQSMGSQKQSLVAKYTMQCTSCFCPRPSDRRLLCHHPASSWSEFLPF